MAKRIDGVSETVSFSFEGQTLETAKGDSVAAALAVTGHRHLRNSVVSAEPRGIYCMIGTCFDCLVEVNGVPNVQACRTTVQDGMVICRQSYGESGQ